MIKCLVLEDELAAQEILLHYIEQTPFLTCLGVYESGLDIPLALLSETDVLFLDIQLPELNGISFLKTIESPPKVIVTSAYSSYAVEAFEEAVSDYLVKPMSYDRFLKAVTRVRNQLPTAEKGRNKRLIVYADKTIYKIEVDDILYLKAEVDYVKIITGLTQILVLDSLRNWNDKLKGFAFDQVHRSYIVNRNKVTRISGNEVFISETAIPIGRTYKKDFLSKFNPD